MKKFIEAVCNDLIEYFNFNEYSFYVSFSLSGSSSSTITGDSVGMSITVDDIYLTIELCVFPEVKKMWEMGRYKEIVTMLVHEFSHVLTTPLVRIIETKDKISQNILEEVKERQTERISKIILKGMSEYLLTVKKYVKHVKKANRKNSKKNTERRTGKHGTVRRKPYSERKKAE